MVRRARNRKLYKTYTIQSSDLKPPKKLHQTIELIFIEIVGNISTGGKKGRDYLCRPDVASTLLHEPIMNAATNKSLLALEVHGCMN